ncbi:MAG: hypothetical protein ABJN95_18320 [Maribacter sp.]|uniref:hypothetical protein n=1 Tax=Maribacter sp. TaxID=1897614 RepID=UPI003298740A
MSNKNINKFILTFIFCLSCMHSYAQKEINLDFKSDKKNIEAKKIGIKKGEYFKVTVNELNPILYKAGFKFEDFDLISEPPEALGSLFKGLPSNKAELSLEESYVEDLIKTSDVFVKNFSEIGFYRKEVGNVGKDPTKIIEKCKELREKWIDSVLKKNFTAEAKRINTTNFVSFTELKISEVLFFYDNLKNQNEKSTTPNIQIARILADLQVYYKNLKRVAPSILSGLSAISEGANKKAKDLKFESMSPPHLPEKDLTTAKIYVINRFNPSDTVAIKKLDLFVKNRFKVDFSTGLSGNSIVPRDYYFIKTDSINTDIGNEKGSEIDLGIAALMHIDWQMSESFAFGPAFGISVSLLDEKPRYMLGISGTIGNDKSISISTGLNFAQAKQLSEQVSNDGINYSGEANLSQFESIPLVSKLKSGIFLSVTYNLTRTRK